MTEVTCEQCKGEYGSDDLYELDVRSPAMTMCGSCIRRLLQVDDSTDLGSLEKVTALAEA